MDNSIKAWISTVEAIKSRLEAKEFPIEKEEIVPLAVGLIKDMEKQLERKIVIKACSTCDHGHKYSYQEPCDDCWLGAPDNGFPEWEPRED